MDVEKLRGGRIDTRRKGAAVWQRFSCILIRQTRCPAPVLFPQTRRDWLKQETGTEQPEAGDRSKVTGSRN